MVKIRVRPHFLSDIAPFSVHFFFNQGGNLWLIYLPRIAYKVSILEIKYLSTELII